MCGVGVDVDGDVDVVGDGDAAGYASCDVVAGVCCW